METLTERPVRRTKQFPDPRRREEGRAETRASEPKRISVLFLVDQLTELGGGERILLQIAQSLPADQYRVTIATFRDRPDPWIATLPCDIRILPMTRTYGVGAIQTARQLRRLIRECQVDLVHTFFETSDLFGAVIARLSGVRAIVSSRRDMGILRSPKHAFAYRLISPLYRAVLTVSDQVRAETIRRDRLLPARVITIHNGIDGAGFAEATSSGNFRDRYGIPPQVRLVSTIANLQPWKGVDVFVRAAAEVRRNAPDVHFVVAGAFSDPSLTTQLFTLTRALGLEDRMHWVGPVQGIHALLAESDLFCLLSHSEGFPNVVLEAMAAALPVIATRVGGTPEAVEDGVTGWLVNTGDHSVAAERVLALLGDDRQRASMGEAAQQRVRTEFTSERMMEQYIGVYERVLRNDRSRAGAIA